MTDVTYEYEQRQYLEDLTALYNLVERCCLHDPVFRPEDVDEVLAWHGDRCSGPESSSTAIVKLKDGDYGMFIQSEDYTGHGCQCDSATFREHRLASLLSGLDDYDLIHLLKGRSE